MVTEQDASFADTQSTRPTEALGPAAWAASIDFIDHVTRVGDIAGRRAGRIAVLPAGLLQLVGAAMIGFTLFDPVTPVRALHGPQFITVMILGVLLLLAGPFVLSQSVQRARKNATEPVERTALEILRDYDAAQRPPEPSPPEIE